MKLRFTFLGLLLTTMSFAQTIKTMTDINPGSNGAFEESDNQILATDDFVYFFADDGTHGNELWKSDGTEAGTQLVMDINPGEEDAFFTYISDIERIFKVGEHIVFYADNGVNGTELWTTDGTEAGTQMLVDIYEGSTPGIQFSTRHDSHVMNDILYFPGSNEEFGRELWRTDGTASGTYMVKNVRYQGASSAFDFFLEFNGLLYFSADEGWIQGGLGQELYVSDGTEAGTHIVKDINVGGDSSTPIAMTHAGDFFYFVTEGSLNDELWRSDGTEAGTTLIKDGYESISEDLVVIGSRLYFTSFEDDIGPELWTSDGTTAGTFLLKDIIPGTEGSYPHNFVALNGKAYFIAESDNSDNLWVSDGTEAGTMKVLDGFANSLTIFNDKIIYQGPIVGGWGSTLWESDGTTAGTNAINSTLPDVEIIGPHGYTMFQDKLIFVAYGDDFGYELWEYETGEGVTSVNSTIQAAEDYSITPVPADQFITLNFKDSNNKTLNIYNAIGKLIYSKQDIDALSFYVDINEFQSGMYFTEIVNSKDLRLTKRFIVK